MKRLLLILFILTSIAPAYWEISEGVPSVFSADGDQQWRMWAGQDAASSLFNDSLGILLDDILLTVIIGNFTPGASRTRHTAVGMHAGEGFDGDFTTSIGLFAGWRNTANTHTVIGAEAGLFNEGLGNTALGAASFNFFTVDTGSAKNITSVDFANDQVTISGGHGFGTDGAFRNLSATTTGLLPTGLDESTQTWEIISSTVLECRTDSFTDAGTGTHTLTPQFIYTNSTAVGANSQPDASNQVVLGNTSVTSIKTSGAFESPLKVTNRSGTDAVITMDGTSNDPGKITYESDNALFVTDKDWRIIGTLRVDDIVTIRNGFELRFNDTGDSDYVGFKAPALTGSQIWILPAADGQIGSVLTTDGSGNTSWTDNASEKTWAFMSRDASSGTNYIGGFYKFGATDNDFNPSITFGTANVSYAAHFFLVQAAGASGGTDTVIRVTGTTINDQGTRATGVNVDITVDDAGSAGTYYETVEKWLGQVTIEKQSGPDLLCNYGFTKYWDNNNTDFRVAGIEATWLGAKNDANPDILLRHHKAGGWTYNAAAEPTPPAEIASMATDHGTEIQIATAQEGAWKRDNLSVDVAGSGIEGTIIELVTTTNRTYAIGNFLVRIVPIPPAVVTDKLLLETGDAILLETGDGMLLES